MHADVRRQARAFGGTTATHSNIHCSFWFYFFAGGISGSRVASSKLQSMQVEGPDQSV